MNIFKIFINLSKKYSLYRNLFFNTVSNNILSIIQYSLIFYIFGTSRQLEIFFYSIFVVEVIDKIFQIGLINNLILPNYISLLNQSKKSAYEYLSSFINLYLYISIGVVLALYFNFDFVLGIIYGNLNDSEFLIVLTNATFLIFLIPLKIFNSIVIVAFRAIKVFGVHEFTSSISKLITITLLIFFSEFGISILFYGIIITVLIRFIVIVLLLFLKKIKVSLLNFSFKNFGKIDSKIFISILINSSCLITRRSIVVSMFTLLSPGIYAIFKYFELAFEILNVLSTKLINNIFLVKLSYQLQYNYSKNITNIRLYYLSFFFIFVSVFLFSFNDTILLILNGYNLSNIDSNLFNIFLIYFTVISLFETITTLVTTENIYKRNFILQIIINNFIGLFFAYLAYLYSDKYGIYSFLIIYFIYYSLRLLLSLYVNFKTFEHEKIKFKKLKSTLYSIFIYALLLGFVILFDQVSFFNEFFVFILCTIFLLLSFLSLRFKFIVK